MSGQLLHQWPVKPIMDICEIFSDGNWIESKDQSPSGIRLVQTGNIGDGVFKDRKDKARYISESTFSRLNCTEIFEGDCLISRLPRPVGRACLIPNTGERMITAVDCSILRFRQDMILPQYFVYYSKSAHYNKQIQPLCTGSTRKRISRKNLGKIEIPIPTLKEQQKIISILDEAFENIKVSQFNIEEKISSIIDTRMSKSNQIFQELEDNTPIVEISSVCEEIFAGGDVPKDNHSKERTKKYTIPIIGNAVKNHGLYGYTDEARVTKPAITIAGRGSGTGHTEIRNEHFFPIVRLIVLIPNTEKISLKFLKFSIQNLVIARSGSAIPQLTVPMIKQYSLNLPEIKAQKSIEILLEDLTNQSNQFLDLSRQKLASLKELEQSILQEAFNGTL